MGKKKLLILLISLAVVLLVTPLGVIVVQKKMDAAKEQKKIDELNATTFASYGEYEIFQKVPLLTGKNATYNEAEEFGGKSYGIDVHDTTFEEYQAYLTVLEKNGFDKQVDNGKEGLEGYVYTSHYLKDDLLVSATHFPNENWTVIEASENTALSEHLFYDESYVADNIPGAKTTFHLQELYSAGNSFIFQLKNGNFILNDGGNADELPYLLDYLEKLAPNGQKPVIEAWFVSHSHIDHVGVFKELMSNRDYIDRIIVEGVYFTEISEEAGEFTLQYDNMTMTDGYVTKVPRLLKNSEGKAPTVYRCRMGEKYYFNDITIDVVYSHYLIPGNQWNTGNGASTWLMYTIEGQKVLITGDGEWDNMQVVMGIYDKEYFDLTLYQVPHHGASVWQEFTDYLGKIRTFVMPSYNVDSVGAGLGELQNEYLRSVAEEGYAFGSGTVVFEFPYTIGSAKTLAPTEWIYHTKVPERYRTEEK